MVLTGIAARTNCSISLLLKYFFISSCRIATIDFTFYATTNPPLMIRLLSCLYPIFISNVSSQIRMHSQNRFCAPGLPADSFQTIGVRHVSYQIEFLQGLAPGC